MGEEEKSKVKFSSLKVSAWLTSLAASLTSILAQDHCISAVIYIPLPLLKLTSLSAKSSLAQFFRFFPLSLESFPAQRHVLVATHETL